jgi:hypothetical protein
MYDPTKTCDIIINLVVQPHRAASQNKANDILGEKSVPEKG